MSLRYKGARISATPPTTTGGESGVASGAWTLEQQFQAQGAGNWPTPVQPKYIEDVFSTWLYTGNGSIQTITNGIDLSTKGGLVWIKNRTQAASHYFQDTVRGANNYISSNNTNAEASLALNTVFNTDGFSQNNSFGGFNGSGDNYASWTFRKQPKFFDIVTYTGNGTAGRTIAHNLGSVPGCIIVKRTDTTGSWFVYHRSLGASDAMLLNLTNATNSGDPSWNSTNPTSTVFTVGSNSGVNASGNTYVAYLFAHDAGGFGLTGTDNVISCGSITTDSGGVGNVSLGYEPQWVLVKNAQVDRGNVISGWILMDNMRGFTVNTGSNKYLAANLADAEYSSLDIKPNATGFRIGLYPNEQYIYIAIRRGPMRTPTDATKVFSPAAVSTDINPITTNFPVDMFMEAARAGNAINTQVGSRLTGNQTLQTASTAAEVGRPPAFWSQNNTSYTPYIFETAVVAYAFRRAPSFFDEVCYTGTNATQTLTHNLTVVPQMWIVKNRTSSDSWIVGGSVLGSATADRTFLQLDLPKYTQANTWTTPTTTTFGIGTAFQSDNGFNASGQNYVAYLFSTCAGVSKVGSYTGTATTKQIDCGFTSGSRFVLIKRIDDSGDWYVWDSARGIVAGNDPYLLLNSTAAEVTSTDYVDTYSAGFEISSTAPAAINASGGTFIFLAIA